MSRRGFASIVFDCDSTLSAIEGIDELAGEYAEQSRALTDAAMDGSIPLEEVYGRRLALIRPSRARVDALTATYIREIVPDAVGVIQALMWLGKDVRIVSGGLLPAVAGIAEHLGVPLDHVAAVRIDFDERGEYSGFDAASPLTRNGGKTQIIQEWRLAGPTLLVGDGATDLEAKPVVDAFAAFMGVAHRQKVAAAADMVITARSLAPILALAADESDGERLARSEWAELLLKGEQLLA